MSTEVLVTTARRSWPMELKRQILGEAERPGSSICSVEAPHFDRRPMALSEIIGLVEGLGA